MGKTNQLGVLADVFVTDASNNVGIGGSPSGSYKLEVTGTAKVSGILTLGSTISNGTYAYTLPSATGTLALTSALGDYLPLAGGTLTGALSGTSASFSSTATATAFIPSGATVPTNGMYLSAANTLNFSTNTTNRLTINSTGNIGIGAVPSGYGARLAIKMPNTTFWNGISIYSSTNESQIYMGHDGTNGAIGTTYGASGSFTPLIFQTSETERMRISSGGNLFVGTLSDRELFNLGGNTALINSNTYSTSLSRSIIYYSSTISYGLQPIANINFLTQGDAASAMTFTTRSSAVDYAERMRITTNGDLYIGTTSTINSNSSVFQMAFDNNTRTGMALKGTAAGSFGAIYFYNNSGTLQGSISSNGTGTTFYNTNSSDVRLKKNFEKWDENVSDKFFQLEPKLFNYLTDEDGTNKTKGYIANDAVKDFPEAYPLGQDGYYSFNPSGMTVYLMKAIQELNERLNKAGL